MAMLAEVAGTKASVTRADLAIGLGFAALIHAVLGVSLILAPAGHTGAPPPEKLEKEGCASVVSPSCIGLPGVKKQVVPPLKQQDQTEVQTLRCPEPVRRLLRRDEEPPLPVAVDLLQAQLVAALGDENATPRADVGQRPGSGGAQAPKPEKKLAEAMGEQSKLGNILEKDEGGDARKKKLGNILGTATGSKDGEGKVNMSGSAYIRVVKQSVTSKFQAPGNIPPWELSGLSVKVRIDRMTATGTILSYHLDKQSGNETFDEAVAAFMAGYKSGMRTLPTPPDDILEQINSRGFTIEFAVKH
jgi:hypothetical protein